MPRLYIQFPGRFMVCRANYRRDTQKYSFSCEIPPLCSSYTTTEHKEGEQLEDRRSVRASSCNSGDGTDQRVQSLMFMMMMMMIMMFVIFMTINEIRISWCQIT